MALRLHASHGDLQVWSRHEHMHILESQQDCLTSALAFTAGEHPLQAGTLGGVWATMHNLGQSFQ